MPDRHLIPNPHYPSMRPLDGIRVLDLTRLLPGAVATMTLGDFGADVIKIEKPGIGDPARAMRLGGARAGTLFLAISRNKRSLAVDLKQEAGRELFMKLAARADVLVEGFRPGVMDRLGLGYDRLREANPRLVYCAITGYGQDGPYRAQAGHDINYLGVAGVLGVNGAAGGPPVIPGVQVADIAGGSLQAVIGILLALAARARTGEGQLVDVSMMDGALALMHFGLAEYLTTGVVPERGTQGLSGRYACYRIYETRDGRHLALGALEPQFWTNACRVLGREDLIALQFAEGEAQAAAIDALEALFRTRAAAEWLAAFAGIDACLTPVHDVAEAVADPQVRHRGLIAAQGGIRQIAPTVRLSATPGEIRTPPPHLGEHTRSIMAELGYADEEIDELARQQTVELR